MSDMEKVKKGLRDLRRYIEDREWSDNREDMQAAKVYWQTVTDAIELLKEQEELLRKLQKDKDRLCLEVSEWKHKFYDAPPKFVPQGIVDQIVFERDTALSQLEQLGKGLGSTFLMRELSDNR